MYVLPPVVTVAAGALTWFVGRFLVRKISFFSKYNLPAPVIGGLLAAIIITILHARNLQNFTFDKHLVNALMIGFFTSLGFGASVQELKKGGKAVITFLVLCTVLLLVQVCVGAIVAVCVGKPPLFGVLTSAVSLVGGPGTALSFAPVFEARGVENAATAGLAAAMLGIVLGGVLGSPLATVLIQKLDLKPGGQKTGEKIPVEDGSTVTLTADQMGSDLIYHTAWILVVGAAGWYLSLGIAKLGITLPFYIGAMILASIARNIDDKFKIFKINPNWIDAIGGTCLALFIAVSMMTLELWGVAAVAGPLLTNVLVQTFLVFVFSWLVVFRFCGKDFDAAVISGGTMGFMLGTTANALATMTAVTQRFGSAPRAFLVVPLVGACFIDFVNALIISIAINIFG